MSDSFLKDGPITSEIISEVIALSGKDASAGGHSLFLGRVRDDEVNGKHVVAIEYSAYESMVNVEAEKIREIVITEFNDVKSLFILHSRGIVNAGAISLFVLAAAGHRQQAMQACSMAVELIKDRLPVWKKEIFNDESSGWKQNDPH